MKDIGPRKEHSKVFKHALNSLNKTRRETTQNRIETISKTRTKIAEAKKRIKEIEKELPKAQASLDKMKAEFLELSDEKQHDVVVDLARKKAYVKSLSQEKQRLNVLIHKGGQKIENWLEDLDKLRREEYEARERRASVEEARIAASLGHDAVVKVIKRRFIEPFKEIDALSVEELRNDPEAFQKAETLFHLFGLPFPNRVLKIFPGSNPEDFPQDLFESVRTKFNAVKAMQR